MSFFLPRSRLWFRLLRRKFRQSQHNLEFNRSLAQTEPSVITGQKNCPQYFVGSARMGSVGCEIAALYNALCFLGRPVSCPELILEFEQSSYLMGVLHGGRLGSDPYAIGEYLQRHQISFRQYQVCSDFRQKVSENRRCFYILSYWNSNRIRDGLHTIACYREDVGSPLLVLNLHTNSGRIERLGISDQLLNRKRFIVGYEIKF